MHQTAPSLDMFTLQRGARDTSPPSTLARSITKIGSLIELGLQPAISSNPPVSVSKSARVIDLS